MYRELPEVSPKWYNLSLALGLDTGILNIIEHDNKECETCLRKALYQRHTIRPLTWAEIDTALRQRTVQMNALADKIQENISTKSLLSRTCSSQPSSDPTPECVVRYSSFLKDKYKQMSSLPDDWPPPLKDKFSKLALIEKKQIPLPQAKHTQSIEYDYATGNVDNIVKRKQVITLEKIFEPLPGDSKVVAPNRYTVVIDGAPGVGKTTLSRKICIDWAQGKLIKDHHTVILKPLRELRGHTAASLSDLLKADDPELKEQIIKHIQETSGLGVMFIFDGFDELSSQQRSDKNTLLWEIIRGNSLHNCSVLVTSRSYASGPLQDINRVNRVNRHVEVLGFKRKDIEHCIKQNITDKEKAEKLIQMLKERLDIVSLCYIPLNCRIVLYVYQKKHTLPDTLTQLYEVFILYTVKHYKPGINEIKYANNIEDFPATIIKCLDSLCELAYTGMTQDKLVFKYKEVTQEFDTPALSLGLLNLIETFSKEQTEAYYYQFLHLTIQEFLAARHLALKKSKEDKLEFITSKIDDDRFRMTLLFLSGLTKLDFLPVEQAFPALKSIETGVCHYFKTKTKSLRKPVRTQFLFLAHLLYESRQTTYNWLFPCLVTNSLNLSEHSLSQFDCLVLANFLALTPKDHVWDDINLSQCSLSSDTIKLLVSKKHSQRDISVLCLTKRLDLCSYKSARISQNSFTALFEKDSKLEYVKIPPLEFKEIICCKSPLGEALHMLRANSLQELIMTSDTEAGWAESEIISKSALQISKMKICSGVIKNFIESVKHKKVKTIVLYKPDSFEDCSLCASSESDVWDSFCNVIKNCKHIQHLHINKSHINAQDISSLIATLQNKRNLRTLQLEGSKINYKGLIHLRNNLPVNVSVHISISNNMPNLIMYVCNDNHVCVVFKSPDEHIEDIESDDLFTVLLEQQLPQELNRVIVTAESFLSKALLRSVGNSKIVASLTLVELNFTQFAKDCRDMLESTNTLQTLTLDSCELNGTSIKHLEDGLSCNQAAVELKLEYSGSDDNFCAWHTPLAALKVRSQNLHELNIERHTLSKERRKKLSKIVTTCKQLRVLKVWFGDNIQKFFSMLYRIIKA
ncbi:NACHT, LRR and PYD domains-containing protein 5-like [Halichondria panicea]|uniref:NACHT, LRR and PYD domains-containing protein 5-like n=1 Tax=Halichondria panicea TaxID=6063 RepID=UPI00312BA5E8